MVHTEAQEARVPGCCCIQGGRTPDRTAAVVVKAKAGQGGKVLD
jgi:hypothetical protein